MIATTIEIHEAQTRFTDDFDDPLPDEFWLGTV